MLLAGASFPAAALAQEYQWPPEGAPVCLANGDQIRLGIPTPVSSPSQGIGLFWITHGAADTLRTGGMGVTPPTGACGGVAAVFDGEILGNLVTTRVPFPFLLGCPCNAGDGLAAYAWLGRRATTDDIVAEWDSNPVTVVRTRPHGALSSPGLAATGAHPAFQPDSAIIVCWSETTGSGSEIRVQRVNGSRLLTWGDASGVPVATAQSISGALRAVRLDDGSTLIVWIDDRGSGNDVFAMRLLSDGTRAPGWPATGVVLEGRSEISSEVHLVRVQGEPPFVVWQEAGARFGGGTSIVARKLLAGGLPDPAWSDSGVVLTSSPTVDHLEDAQPGLVVWSDSRAATPDDPTDLFAQSFQNDGTRTSGWPADGVALCTAPGRQDHARVSAHGPFYAWEDRRSGVPKVYATSLTAAGQRPCCNWLPNGNPVALADGEQRNPVVDGPTGGWVAWEDSRNLASTGVDIYGQIFNLEGRNVDVTREPAPAVTMLRAPYPNPASGVTQLRLELPRAASLRLAIFDVLGRHVQTLAEGAFAPGAHAWTWSGTDDSGRPVPAGLYHVRAVVDGFSQTRSVVRVR